MAIILILNAICFYQLYQTPDRLDDIIGTYSYSVQDTPYGDYNGYLYLWRKENKLEGEIENEESTKYYLKWVGQKGNSLIFKSNIEETKSTLSVEFYQDSLRGTIKVKGDDFPYEIKGKKIKNLN
jgi:hypothetical protein